MKSVVCGCFGEVIERRVEREFKLEFNQWQQDKCWMVGRWMYVYVYGLRRYCLMPLIGDVMKKEKN